MKEADDATFLDGLRRVEGGEVPAFTAFLAKKVRKMIGTSKKQARVGVYLSWCKINGGVAKFMLQT